MKAPGVTLTDVQSAICAEDYVLMPDSRTTICQLTLDNGFTVRGESSCDCLENFDFWNGRNVARRNAVDKVWQLLGFRLADKLRAANTVPVYRSAVSGEYVSEEYAKAHPATTVRED